MRIFSLVGSIAVIYALVPGPGLEASDAQLSWAKQRLEETVLETGADVLPALQRLVWLGRDNHTVVTAGIKLKQLEQASGIPFLDLQDCLRIDTWLSTLRSNEIIHYRSPVEFLEEITRKAELAWKQAGEAVSLAGSPGSGELVEWRADARAVWLTARFYLEKLRAVEARVLWESGKGSEQKPEAKVFLEKLQKSVVTFRELSEFTARHYESLSDVPAWHPDRLKIVPYH